MSEKYKSIIEKAWENRTLLKESNTQNYRSRAISIS